MKAIKNDLLKISIKKNIKNIKIKNDELNKISNIPSLNTFKEQNNLVTELRIIILMKIFRFIILNNNVFNGFYITQLYSIFINIQRYSSTSRTKHMSSFLNNIMNDLV